MKRFLSLFIVLLFSVACATGSSIFPDVSLSTTESSVVLPNPISVVVDQANSRVVLVNSNVDVLFKKGSIAMLTVDASDVNSPIVAIQDVIETPNFGGRILFDGASSVYVPFRSISTTNSEFDTFMKYTLGTSTITAAVTSTVADNPFGVATDGTQIFAVSDFTFGVYDTNLNLTKTVDLKGAVNAGIESSYAQYVLGVAVDGTNNLAVVSNAGGKAFIIDLSDNSLRQTISSPLVSSDVLINSSGILYLLDSALDTLYVFNLNSLPAASSSPENVDDSKILVTAVGVGDYPQALAIDEANNRLYVGNAGDDTISVIDTLTHSEIARISLDQTDIASSFLRDGEEPYGLTVGTFNGVSYLFAACIKSGSLVTINTNTLKVVSVFPNTAK